MGVRTNRSHMERRDGASLEPVPFHASPEPRVLKTVKYKHSLIAKLGERKSEPIPGIASDGASSRDFPTVDVCSQVRSASSGQRCIPLTRLIVL